MIEKIREARGGRVVAAALLTLLLAIGVVACGDDDDETSGDGGGGAIVANSENEGVNLTIGSKNFTEQIILGEIYSQALEAAGYQVRKDLNLGSETVARQAVKQGQISGYPEYASTALTSFFEVEPEEVPADAEEAFEDANEKFEEEGLVAFPPTPFASANAVGVLAETAEELELETVSDLEDVAGELSLYGSPECRQRIDCLAGLEELYGLEFESFTPVDIGLRYEVLDNEQADLSILFTTDAQLASDESEYVILEDDQEVFPAGNVIFVTTPEVVEEAGPDYEDTIVTVQEGLSLEVMQELDARVDIEKEAPAKVAADYLEEAGYVE